MMGKKLKAVWKAISTKPDIKFPLISDEWKVYLIGVIGLPVGALISASLKFPLDVIGLILTVCFFVVMLRASEIVKEM